MMANTLVKGIVPQKIKILSSFTHTYEVPSLYEFFRKKIF